MARGDAETRRYDQELCASASLRAAQPHAPGDAPRWLPMASAGVGICLGREPRAETRRRGDRSKNSASRRVARISPIPRGGSMEWRPGTPANPSSFARYGPRTGPRLAHSSACGSICFAITSLPTGSLRLWDARSDILRPETLLYFMGPFRGFYFRWECAGVAKWQTR